MRVYVVGAAFQKYASGYLVSMSYTKVLHRMLCSTA